MDDFTALQKFTVKVMRRGVLWKKKNRVPVESVVIDSGFLIGWFLCEGSWASKLEQFPKADTVCSLKGWSKFSVYFIL